MEAEACFLIGRGGVVLWADRSTSSVAMPDAVDRWQAIWSHRARLVEIVHTHPGGWLAFSAVDDSTMHALDAALGRSLWFGVVTADGYARIRSGSALRVHHNEPWWVPLLRIYSRMDTRAGA